MKQTSPSPDPRRRTSRGHVALLVGAMIAVAASSIWLIGSCAAGRAPVTEASSDARPRASVDPSTSKRDASRRSLDATVVEAAGERLVLRPLQRRSSDVVLLVRHGETASFDQTHMQSHIASREPTRVSYEVLNGRRYVTAEQDPASG